MLGAGERGALLRGRCWANRSLGLMPIAFLDNQPDAWNQTPEAIPVVGPLGAGAGFRAAGGGGDRGAGRYWRKTTWRGCCRN